MELQDKKTGHNIFALAESYRHSRSNRPPRGRIDNPLKHHALSLVFLAAFSLFLFIPNLNALDVPKLEGRVNDYAQVISPSAKAALENELKSFEQTDSTQIVILTVPSLEGDAIDNFSMRVAEAWKIGQKGKDNGIMFTVSKQERKIRIEVGKGLEGKLTDLMAGRVIDLVVKPRFKRGDFDGGFLAGVSSLIDATRGEFKAEPVQHSKKQKGSSPFFSFLIFGLMVLVFLGSMSRILGGIGGAIGLPSLVHFSLFPLGIVGVVISAALGMGMGLLLPSLFSSSGRHGSHGGFWPGGGYYGGGGGFGSSDFGGGDSFGGGGGDFGGGGASGDW